jgi:hypothetical protein
MGAMNSYRYRNRNGYQSPGVRTSILICETGRADLGSPVFVTLPAMATRNYASNEFGRIEMAVTPERTQKRHVREKAIVDHLAKNVYNSKPSAEKHASKNSTTATGLPVEDQVRKEWDPRKGGLPTF